MSRITKIGIPSGGTTSQVLVKNSNTDYDVTWGAGGGGGITGSGTSGYVTFWNGSSTVTGEANLFWDATNDRLGIGTSSPSVSLNIVNGRIVQDSTSGDAFATSGLTGNDNILIGNRENPLAIKGTVSTGVSGISLINSNGTLASAYGINNPSHASAPNVVYFWNYLDAAMRFGTFSTEKMRISNVGNLLVGTSTDSGFRLDISGTSRFQNDITISDTRNFILSTTTGTKIGTSTSQKIGFFNATPIVQPSAVTSAQGIADALTSLGLLASSTISGGGSTYSISTKTTTYNETATSGEIILLGDTTTAGFTITLPSAVSNTAKITIKKIAGANNLTIDGNGSETIDGGLTAVLVRVYESITLVSDNSNWHII